MAVIAALVTVPRPAAAYDPDPTVYWLVQNADTCDRDLEADPLNLLTALEDGARCFIQGSELGWPFPNDPNSQNVLFELWSGGEAIGMIAFEAFDERLAIWDLANDGDTFYVWIDGDGPFFAPGTSSSLDFKRFDLNLADGVRHSIRITDDKDGHDTIATSSGSLPYLVA